MQKFEPTDGGVPGMKKIPWRFAAYSVIVLYLVGDLYLFHGPLRRRVDRMQGAGVAAGELAAEEGIVATVNAHPIRRQELDRAVDDYCLRRGLVTGELERKRVNAIRWRVLGQLVVDRLIWFHSIHTPVELGEAELLEAHERFRRGFGSDEELEEAAAGQGFSPLRLAAYVENQAMQRAWIEQVIAPHLAVTEAEVAARYESDPEAAALPERLRARHIFLATLDKDVVQVGAAMGVVAERLAGGEDFAALARELSEDERSRGLGGDLGWMSAARLPEDFAAAVFSLAAGEVSAPFQTRLGWHIAEVVERKPAGRAGLDALRAEIHATLEGEKRALAIDALIAQIRSKAKIRYFGDFLWVQ